MTDESDPVVGFGVPLRESLRHWLKVEAARRRIRMQDLVDEIVADAKQRTEDRHGWRA